MQWIYLGLDKNKEEKFTCVDDDTFEIVKMKLWGVSSNGMAKSISRKDLSFLHKEILNIKKFCKDKVVHLNGDKLDNRKINLVKKAELHTKLPVKKQTFFTNIPVKKWTARIRFNGEQIFLGSYSSEQEAIAAYTGAWYILKKSSNEVPALVTPSEDDKREAIAYRYWLLKTLQDLKQKL